MTQAIVIDGVKITPEIIDGIRSLRTEASLAEMKDSITRLLFMLSLDENSRTNKDFEEGVFILRVLYNMSDSIFEQEGGE